MATTNPGRAWRLTVAGAVATLLAGVGAFLLLGEIGVRPTATVQLVGSALAIVALSGGVLLRRTLVRWLAPVALRLPRFMRGRRFLQITAALIATSLLSVCYRDIAFSHDHAEHCFKAYHFWREMLGRGRLRGWSHFLAFGYPSGELTPFGPEAWVALFRAATLGLLSWTLTYAVAFAGVVVFAALALYTFTRRFFGAAAGVVATVIWVLDPGGWYQGGWFWLGWLGVWPVTLAMSFTLLALVKLADVVSADPSRDRRRDSVWAALWMLASLVTHQLPIVAYGIALPCMLVGEALSRRLTRAAVWRFCATVALGVGLACFYLVPMFGRNALTQDLGVLGFPLSDLANRLVDMRLFENGWSPVIVLGLLGGVLCARTGGSALFFVLSSAIFVLLSSDILVRVFHAELALPAVLKLECQRMLLVAKLFVFPLAAHAAVTLFRRPPRATEAPETDRPASPVARAAAVVIVALLAAPVLKPAVLRIYQTQVNKDIEDRSRGDMANGLRAFFGWSKAERAATDEPYRIAYSLKDQHDHIVSISPAFNDTLLYKVGYTSAQQFVRFPMSGEPELLEALSVKYVLSDRDLGGPAYAREATFGPLRLYRFTRYQPRHPFTVIGTGEAELLRFDPERVQLRVTGAGPDTRIKLHVALFPRWEATQNGRRLPISPAPVHGMEYPILMEVPVSDGDLVFTYVRRAPDWIGLGVTLLALAVLALLVTGRIDRVRERPWFVAAWSASRRAAPIGLSVVAGGGLVLLVILVVRMASPARLPADSPFAIAPPASELSAGGQRCIAREPTVWSCGPFQVRRTVMSGSYGSHLCMTATASPVVLSVTAPLGSFIRATYDAAGMAPGRLRVSADGNVIGEMPTRGADQGLQFVQIDTRARSGQTARLRFELEGGPNHCFDLALVPADAAGR